MAVQRFALQRKNSLVIEVGSNDGYLLNTFPERGIRVLGIEPSANVAAAAQNRGIPTRVEFFGLEAAESLRQANLQPDLFDRERSGPCMPENRERWWWCGGGGGGGGGGEITHGGSLRIYVQHQQNSAGEPSPAMIDLIAREEAAGIRSIDYYRRFQTKVDRVKWDLMSFLVEQKRLGKRVAGYGAAAKGNTLLNYCGIKRDLVEFVVDLSPHKQGKYLPGSHIPVVAEPRIRESRPDYVVILPWNIRQEIMTQLAYIRTWGAQFVLPIPELQVV